MTPQAATPQAGKAIAFYTAKLSLLGLECKVAPCTQALKRLWQYRHRTLLAGLVLSLPLASLSTQPLLAAPTTDSVVVKILPDAQRAKRLHGEVLIQAPPAFVWGILTNYRQYQQFVPGYKQCVPLGGKHWKIAMSISRVLPTLHYQVQIQEDRASQTVAFHRVSGDLEHLSGIYRLKSQNQGTQTLLSYDLTVDAGNVPDIGLSGLLKANTKSTLQALEAKAESEHRQTIIGKR
ncbi:MAG: SRPBCC family protein [Candidatus Melainabacteria bacterium]|nr:SRPBCC family protein [Candidatus Melainabacteria bacterium]